MLLNFLTEAKRNQLLGFTFISYAADKYNEDKLKGEDLHNFIENLQAFKKQLVPKIISQQEFMELIRLALIRSTSKHSFEVEWNKQWDTAKFKKYFGNKRVTSIFSRYSSRGWKIHTVFQIGKEKDVARFLFEHGLYFKVEAGIGTYFNGIISSGATIYIGSYDNMLMVAEIIVNSYIAQFLIQGAYYTAGNRRFGMGSGCDIEIRPNVMARFDVAKTKFGWAFGNRKYAEHGLATWTGLGGIPILKKFESEVRDVETRWNSLNSAQRQIYRNRLFKRVYEESKQELIKDFGEEFVFGRKGFNRLLK